MSLYMSAFIMHCLSSYSTSSLYTYMDNQCVNLFDEESEDEEEEDEEPVKVAPPITDDTLIGNEAPGPWKPSVTKAFFLVGVIVSYFVLYLTIDKL